MNEYPEHERLKKVQDKSQAIGEFLEWAHDEKEYVLCWKSYMTQSRFEPIQVSKELLLAEFYAIDLQKIEQEKRLMLEEMRQANKR